eukprot:COSAG03_NODE_598_length_6798_cov_39.483654_6_plen_176_part_00
MRVVLSATAERPGVIGRDLSLPRHNHRPITGALSLSLSLSRARSLPLSLSLSQKHRSIAGLWRWQELEMRIAKDDAKQQHGADEDSQGGGGSRAFSAAPTRPGGVSSLSKGGGGKGLGKEISSATVLPYDTRVSYRSKGTRRRSSFGAYSPTVERLFERTKKTRHKLPLSTAAAS